METQNTKRVQRAQKSSDTTTIQNETNMSHQVNIDIEKNTMNKKNQHPFLNL